MFAKSYAYVGSEELPATLAQAANTWLIKSAADVQRWINETGQTIGYDSMVTASFVIKKDKKLYIGDRQEEHVQFARGENVLAAGEMSFDIDNDLSVASINNLSTNYCPEPKSWKYVDKALNKANIPHVDYFTSEFIFRRCTQCQSVNVIKDDWYFCAVCDAELEKKWNFQ